MNIGFIADDSKKKLMQNFCIAYRGILNKHSLYATGTTGRLIEEATTLSVNKFLEAYWAVSSSLRLRSKIIAWIWYFTSVIQEKSARAIQREYRECCIFAISIAFRWQPILATAELLIRSLDSGDLEWREAYRS